MNAVDEASNYTRNSQSSLEYVDVVKVLIENFARDMLTLMLQSDDLIQNGDVDVVKALLLMLQAKSRRTSRRS